MNPKNHPALIAMLILLFALFICGWSAELAMVIGIIGLLVLVWAMLKGKGNVWG